jgi:hypothetical protein
MVGSLGFSEVLTGFLRSDQVFIRFSWVPIRIFPDFDLIGPEKTLIEPVRTRRKPPKTVLTGA